MKFLFGIVIAFGLMLLLLWGFTYLHEKYSSKKEQVSAASDFNPQLYYDIYADLLVVFCKTVNEFADSLGLYMIRHPVNHVPEDNIRWHTELGAVFVFTVDRAAYFPTGLTGKPNYYNVDRKEIVLKLNQSLPSACVNYGLPRYEIIEATDIGNGRINLYLVQV